MIPRIIHFCWFGGSSLPQSVLKCIESWKKYCPDYEIIRWDETNYDYSKNQYMHDAYKEKKYGFVPDYARLDIIYHYGGIYLDTDVEIIKPLDDLLDNYVFMGFEKTTISPGLIIGAEKGAKEIFDLMMTYEERDFYNSDGSLNLTPSPIYATNFFKEKGLKDNGKSQIIGNMRFYSSEYFNPKDMLTDEINITNNTYTIHHYDASWWGEKEKKEFQKQQRLRNTNIWLWRFYQAMVTLKRDGVSTLIYKMKNIKR